MTWRSTDAASRSRPSAKSVVSACTSTPPRSGADSSDAPLLEQPASASTAAMEIAQKDLVRLMATPYCLASAGGTQRFSRFGRQFAGPMRRVGMLRDWDTGAMRWFRRLRERFRPGHVLHIAEDVGEGPVVVLVH